MAQSCDKHESHPHQHGPGCGHTAIQHEGHTDYLHDGHMHHPHEGHTDEHSFMVSAQNPDERAKAHDCGAHERGHKHGPGCGHEAVPHGDHTDYLVGGHLHHSAGGQCHDHGEIKKAA